jgi:CelD/BcsL family acetyltransferase involved in cellulose biosynthesis
MHVIKTVGREAVMGLRTEWQNLFRSSGCVNPFLSWSWTIAWADQSGCQELCQLVLCRDNGRLVAVLPLVNHRGRLEFFAGPLYADFMGCLCLPGCQDALTAIAEALAERLRVSRIVLSAVHGLDEYVPSIVGALAGRGWSVLRTVHCPNPHVPINGDIESYRASLPKRLRQELRTAINKLNRTGSWRFAEASNAGQAQAWYDDMVAMHQRRQVAKDGRSLFDKPGAVDFFRSMLVQPAEEFEPHLSVIELNGKPISAVYSLICADRFYYWIPTFDKDVQVASVSKLHIMRLIEVCFARKIKAFDFMGGDEPYKRQWTNQSYDNFNFFATDNALYHWAAISTTWVRKRMRTAKRSSMFLGTLWRWLSKLA